jgi:hypothetical protein
LTKNKILAGDGRGQFQGAGFGSIDIEAYAEPFDGAIGFGSEEIEGGYHYRYTSKLRTYHVSLLVSMQYTTDRQDGFLGRCGVGCLGKHGGSGRRAQMERERSMLEIMAIWPACQTVCCTIPSNITSYR